MMGLMDGVAMGLMDGRLGFDSRCVASILVCVVMILVCVVMMCGTVSLRDSKPVQKASIVNK